MTVLTKSVCTPARRPQEEIAGAFLLDAAGVAVEGVVAAAEVEVEVSAAGNGQSHTLLSQQPAARRRAFGRMAMDVRGAAGPSKRCVTSPVCRKTSRALALLPSVCLYCVLILDPPACTNVCIEAVQGGPYTLLTRLS